MPTSAVTSTWPCYSLSELSSFPWSEAALLGTPEDQISVSRAILTCMPFSAHSLHTQATLVVLVLGVSQCDKEMLLWLC
jgi:hypothetical protein